MKSSRGTSPAGIGFVRVGNALVAPLGRAMGSRPARSASRDTPAAPAAPAGPSTTKSGTSGGAGGSARWGAPSGSIRRVRPAGGTTSNVSPGGSAFMGGGGGVEGPAAGGAAAGAGDGRGSTGLVVSPRTSVARARAPAGPRNGAFAAIASVSGLAFSGPSSATAAPKECGSRMRRSPRSKTAGNGESPPPTTRSVNDGSRRSPPNTGSLVVPRRRSSCPNVGAPCDCVKARAAAGNPSVTTPGTRLTCSATCRPADASAPPTGAATLDTPRPTAPAAPETRSPRVGVGTRKGHSARTMACPSSVN